MLLGQLILMETMTSLQIPADIEVAERFVRGKYANQEQCEDILVHTKNYIAVIDGATSTTTKNLCGKKAGRYAAEIVAQQVTQLPPGLALPDAAASLSKALKNEFGNARSDKKKVDGPSASIVMYAVSRREIWRIGTGTFLINGVVNAQGFVLDRVLSAMRSAYIQSYLQSSGTIDQLLNNDHGREVILPMLKRQYVFRNANYQSDFAFGALDGNQIPEKFLEIYTIDNNSNEIILASDGYPLAFPTLKQSEDYLTHIRKTDPLCISNFSSTKGFYSGQESFDDRAYVRFKVPCIL